MSSDGIHVNQIELGILGSLEKVIIANVGRRIVDLIGSVINEKVLALPVLVYREEIQRFLQNLRKLRVFLDGELRGNGAGIGFVRSVHHDFLGRWNVSRNENGSVALLLPQNLFQVLEQQSLHARRHLQLGTAS